jgi:hypothetical protein
MAGSESEYNKEVCDLRHAATLKEIDTLKFENTKEEELLKEDIRDLWAAIEEIRHPSTGHIATLKLDLEKRIDKQEAKFNGLIITIITTVTGMAIAIGAEYLKKFVR